MNDIIIIHYYIYYYIIMIYYYKIITQKKFKQTSAISQLHTFGTAYAYTHIHDN